MRQLETLPLRVFQVDQQVFLLTNSTVESYSLDQLKLEHTERLSTTVDIDFAKQAIVANETSPGDIFCAKNLAQFRNGGVPKQEWVLCYQS